MHDVFIMHLPVGQKSQSIDRVESANYVLFYVYLKVDMTYCITNSNPLSNLIGVTYCGLVLMQTHTLFWGNRKLVRELVLVRHDELWILWDESDNHR